MKRKVPVRGVPAAKSNRRHTINLPLLLTTLGILIVAAPALYFWHGYRETATASALLEHAKTLETDDKWTEAARNYQRYLYVKPEDNEALTRLIDVYSKAATNEGDLWQLTNMLYRAVGREPDRHDLRLLLAEKLLTRGEILQSHGHNAATEFASASKEVDKLFTGGTDESLSCEKVAALIDADGSNTAVKLDDATKVSAARIKAISQHLLLTHGTSGSAADVLILLQRLGRELPKDVRIASLTSELLQSQSGDTFSVEAGEVMDRLVAADPENPDARRARYLFNQKTRNDQLEIAEREEFESELKEDLDAIIQLSPDSVDNLLLAANAAISTDNDAAAAKELLQQAMESDPKDLRPYFALANLLMRSQDRDGAIEVLRKGRTNAPEGRIYIDPLLGNLLIDNGSLDEAENLLTDLRPQVRNLVASTDDANFIARLNRKIDFYSAKIRLARGDRAGAIPELERVVAEFGNDMAMAASPERLDAMALLAKALGDLNQWDRAASYWQNLATVSNHAEVVLRAATAYLQTGQPTAARDLIERFAANGSLTADLHLLRVQSNFLSELRNLQPNWAAIQTVLKEAQTAAPDRWELLIFEKDYLLANPNSANSAPRADMLAKLKDAEQRFADQPNFWKDLAIAYMQLELPADSQRAASRYEEAETSLVNRANFRVQYLAIQEKSSEIEPYLSSLNADVKSPEGRQIEKLRARSLVATQKVDNAKKVIAQLIAADPKDSEAVIMGLELALNTSDLETATKYEDLLRSHPGRESEWRYLRAARLLSSGKGLNDENQRELDELIAGLRNDRNNWFPAIALSAENALRKGDSNRAIQEFQLAIELGDSRLRTFEQLLSQLFNNGRFREAEQVLAKLERIQPEHPLAGSIKIGLAIQSGGVEGIQKAIELAEASAKERPNELPPKLVLAGLYLRRNDAASAEQVLREATSAFPQDPRAWHGLLSVLAQTRQIDKAREVLTSVVADKQLPESARLQLAAQGAELIGDLKAAIDYYQQILKSQPSQVESRLRLAKLLSTIDASAARKEYETVMRQDPNNGVAIRELAGLLAATGQEADWNRAIELLKSINADGAGSATQAILLSQKGQDRDARIENNREARRILETLIRDADDPGSPESLNHRKLLASICEREAALLRDRLSGQPEKSDTDVAEGSRDEETSVDLIGTAREHLRFVVDRTRSIGDLSQYLEFLLRNSAGPLPDVTAPTARDEFSAALLSDAEARLVELKNQEERLGIQTHPRPSLIIEVRLRQIQGRTDEIDRLVKQYISSIANSTSDDATKAQALMGAGNLYSIVGNHKAAEGLYRHVMKLSPRGYVMVVQSLANQGKRSDAIKLCLTMKENSPPAETAILLSRLLTATTETPEDSPEAMQVIEQTLKSENTNVRLLEAAAAMHASRGENEKAIELFRQFTKLEPTNALALNNLATLLAEHPEHHAEALACIERAITAAGRLGGLLDTKGTIYLQMGDAKQAIACLREATAGEATDPRYYFHLAAAYQLAEQADDARNALQSALELGLKGSILTIGDREKLSQLESVLLADVEAVQ